MENEVKIKCDNESESDRLLSKQEKQGNSYILYALLIMFSILISGVLFYLFKLNIREEKSGEILIHERDIKKPLSDYREYRVVRLDNHLDVVLISDPKATKSSASLSVGVGSFMDDKEVQGLAHFCEHMLFLGSKSYPKVGEYEDWLVSNSGSSNAFTEMGRTTFFFEVDNNGFNKSLDMFGKMFSEPLFDFSYMDKEIEAVNSEHEKNLNSDSWRRMQLIRSLSNPSHPYAQFSTGNNQTLRAVGSKELNRLLNKFYQTYYKSFNMKLALLSNSTLDELQKAANKHFTEIKYLNSGENKTANTVNTVNLDLYENLETQDKVYRESELSKIVWYKKVSNGASLDVIFSLDSVYQYYKIKPLDYVDYLLKYAGDKSLLAFLRKRKLANRIDSGFQANHKTFSLYRVNIELTNDGLKDVDLVIRLLFNYLNLIKKTPVSSKIYNEINKISEVNFKFLEKSDDYSNFLSSLSTSMFDYDYINLLNAEFIHSNFDEKVIQFYVKSLTANNSIIVVGSDTEIDDHPFFKDKLKKKEKWYGTEYIESVIDGEMVNNLNSYPVSFDKTENVDPVKSFKIRGENTFITNAKDLVSDCKTSGEFCDVDEFDSFKEDYTPVSVAGSSNSNTNANSNFKVFYKVDKTFKVPKVNIYFKFLVNELKTTAEDFLYLNILTNYFDYTLSTLLAEPIETGNAVELEITDKGIYFSFNCFSDIAEKLVTLVVNEVFKFNPDITIFEEIIEITRQRLNSDKIDKPIMKNKFYFDKIMKYNIIIYSEMLDLIGNKKSNSSAVNKLDFQKFRNVYESFKNNLHLITFFWGNIDKDEVDKIIALINPFIPQVKGSERKTNSENKETNIYNIENSIHLQRKLDQPITFQIKNDAENELNHAVSLYYQIGARDIKKALYMGAIDKCLGQVFFYNLRTVQQLGYIVHASTAYIDSIMYFRILVQGTKKTPKEIEKSISKVFSLALEKIEACNGNKFEEVKRAIKTKLMRKDDNLKERSGRIWKEIFQGTYEFNRSQDLIAALDELEYKVMLNLFKNIFFENPNVITILNYASTYDGNMDHKPETYSLDNKTRIKYSEDFSVLKDKGFIYTYKDYQSPKISLNNNKRKARMKSLRKSASEKKNYFPAKTRH